MNAPYGKNIPVVDEGILPQVLAKRMQLVAKELNSARPTQISTGVPLLESVKIALGTLLSVSHHVALFLFLLLSLSFFFLSLNFSPYGFRSPSNYFLHPEGLISLWTSLRKQTIAL